MIEFTDLTLRESKGDFAVTNQIMASKEWMLRTKAFVSTNTISCFFLLHFFSDSKFVIQETEHPMVVNVPEDDLRYLHEWAQKNGWDGPYVSDRLMNERRAKDFWLRLYRSGIIKNNMLDAAEKEEVARFSKIIDVKDEE